MIRIQPRPGTLPPALLRLSNLTSLSSREKAAVLAAMENERTLAVRKELLTEGREIAGPILLTAGWAARVRLLADGRRQFLSFVLPGDLIGMCRQHRPLAVSTVVALTQISFCPAPSSDGLSGLAEAYAVSQALEEARLLNQILRLGRLSALDRIADLMLEFYERLGVAGLVDGNSFAFPLTQELLADALGLTSVHVNRMLQTLRRDGDLDWRGGRITIRNHAALTSKAGRVPLRVTAVSQADE